MSFNPTDLQQTFEEAVSRFNQALYDDLGSLLHENIVWQRLHHPQSIVGVNPVGSEPMGSDPVRVKPVVDWLKKGKWDVQPQFLPLPGSVTAPVGSDGNSQKIWGKAKWEGKKGGIQEDIEYVFIFTRTNAGAPWLLITAFGHIVASND
jgi:hypothetical protein